MRAWYNDPDQVRDSAKPAITWSMLLEQWTAVTLDLHAIYGVDTASGVLAERTITWLKDRIAGCIGQGGHLDRALGIVGSISS